MARPVRFESDIKGGNLKPFLMLFVLGTASYNLQFIPYLGLQWGHFSHFHWLGFFRVFFYPVRRRLSFCLELWCWNIITEKRFIIPLHQLELQGIRNDTQVTIHQRKFDFNREHISLLSLQHHPLYTLMEGALLHWLLQGLSAKFTCS